MNIAGIISAEMMLHYSSWQVFFEKKKFSNIIFKYIKGTYCPANYNRGRYYFQIICAGNLEPPSFSFFILKGHHHKSSIKPFSAA
jgi:hypothetical protein